MSTMGWVFILMAGIVLRQVSRGRVMETMQDLSDAFLAIVSNDTAKLKEVFARTGDFTTVDKAEETNLGEGTFSGAKVAGDTYNLGAKTKPHVRAVANRLGPMFGIKTIGGWRAVGSVPNSSHPKGLALDLMIDNIPNGMSVGQRVADYAVANASALGITEVIWNRRIWTKSQGWHKYSGPSAHTDHVHLTFKDN